MHRVPRREYVSVFFSLYLSCDNLIKALYNNIICGYLLILAFNFRMKLMFGNVNTIGCLGTYIRIR